jgi:hypothetical protein
MESRRGVLGMFVALATLCGVGKLVSGPPKLPDSPDVGPKAEAIPFVPEKRAAFLLERLPRQIPSAGEFLADCFTEYALAMVGRLQSPWADAARQQGVTVLALPEQLGRHLRGTIEIASITINQGMVLLTENHSAPEVDAFDEPGLKERPQLSGREDLVRGFQVIQGLQEVVLRYSLLLKSPRVLSASPLTFRRDSRSREIVLTIGVDLFTEAAKGGF